jgi:hypothetical protein
MSTPMPIELVRDRLLNFPQDRYLYIGGFMRSVVWAAATIVLLEIIVNFRKHRLRLLPWVASLMATMVTLMTWGRGVLLTNSRANLWDSVLPTLMGITEFCLFAILAPRLFGVLDPSKGNGTQGGSQNDKLEPWHYWFFALAAHAGLASLLVWNRMHLTDVANDFDQRLQPLALKYMGWMWMDRTGAAASCVGFTIFGLVTLLLMRKRREHSERKIYSWVFAILVLISTGIYTKVILDAEDQRNQTDEFVSSVLGKGDSPSDLPVADTQPTAPARQPRRNVRIRHRHPARLRPRAHLRLARRATPWQRSLASRR